MSILYKSCCISAWLVLCALSAAAELTWSGDRLLPAFPAPASTIDCIDLKDAGEGEADLFASLEGIVNRTKPRLACAGPRDAEGCVEWLKIHQLKYEMIDGFQALKKYQGEVNGLIVFDPDRPETINLATTVAGLDNALICDPILLSKLTNAPFNLKVREDFRGRFSNRSEVYDYYLENVWPHCTHRIIAGLSPRVHGDLRDFLVAANAAVVWFDPKNTNDAVEFAKFASDLKPAHTLYMGWWPDEDAGLKWIGQYGVPVLASDFFQNGTLFSGFGGPVNPAPVPPAPPLQNKIYLTFYISDGDNVQYMQHYMRHLWQDPARGAVPIGWTVSPLAADLDPGMLNYYYRTATTNDCLVSGPSGAGYERLDFWKSADLDAFTKLTNPYLERSGLRIITVWLNVSDEVGSLFASNCPALLGLISHEGGSYEKVYGRLPVIGLVEHANYAGSVEKLRAAVNKAASGWDGKSPLFLAVQANAWRLSPSDLKSFANSLDSSKFLLVRPDHLFQLFKVSRAHHPGTF